MSTYIVKDKRTGLDLTQYVAAIPTEFQGAEFSNTDHILLEDIPLELPAHIWLTKQEFFDKLGRDAVNFILSASKTNVDMEAWVKRLDLVTPNADGTSVDLRDPRTIAGIHAISTIMVSLGVVSETWKDEVLNG